MSTLEYPFRLGDTALAGQACQSMQWLRCRLHWSTPLSNRCILPPLTPRHHSMLIQRTHFTHGRFFPMECALPRAPLYGDAQTHAQARHTVYVAHSLVGVRTTEGSAVARTVAHQLHWHVRAADAVLCVRGLGVDMCAYATHARRLGLARLDSVGGNGARMPADSAFRAALHCALHRVATRRYIRKVLSLNVPLAIEDADGDEIIKCALVSHPFPLRTSLWSCTSGCAAQLSAAFLRSGTFPTAFAVDVSAQPRAN